MYSVSLIRQNNSIFAIEHVCDITLKRRIIFESKDELDVMRRFKRLKELRDYEMSLWKDFWENE